MIPVRFAILVLRELFMRQVMTSIRLMTKDSLAYKERTECMGMAVKHSLDECCKGHTRCLTEFG